VKQRRALPEGAYLFRVTDVKWKRSEVARTPYVQMQLQYPETDYFLYDNFADLPAAAWKWRVLVPDIDMLLEMEGKLYLVQVTQEMFYGEMITRVKDYLCEVIE
jgi:hypothetical protein